MHLLGLGLLAVLYATPSRALQESEAGVIDWHKNQIGVPRINSPSTAPVFHRVGKETTRSVLLTATESNVLAALNPANGSLAWRYISEPPDEIVQFRPHNNVVVALSGPGGATLRSFEALTGHLLVEKHLHPPESGRISNPSDLGTDIAFLARDEPTKDKPYPDMFVLTNGHTVRRISGSDGEIRWTWTSKDQSTKFILSDLIATPTAIYLIGLEKASSYTLHLIALSTPTGEEISITHVPSSISHGLTDVIPLSYANFSSSIPVVAWLQQGTLHSFPLTPELRGKPSSIKGSTYKSFIDVGLGHHGQFIAIQSDGSGRAFKLNMDGSGLTSFWDFADSAPSPKYSDSLYAGGLDRDGWPYIARVHWSYTIKRVSIDVLCAHLADGKGMITGFPIPFETDMHGIISHIAIDAANPKGWNVLARVAMTTTTGAVQFWQQDKVQWIREESLASISAAEFVELPEEKVAFSHVEGQETFVARLRRQLLEAQDFPEYLVNFVKRFATGSYASVSSSAARTGPLSRDAFGFRQVIVAATPFGKVFGLDSSTGAILWSRVFGLGWAAEVGGRVIPVKIFVTRTVSDGSTPEVVVVTQRRAENTLVDTVVFHLNALTGEDARNVSRSGDILQGLDIISGPLLETFLFNKEEKTVVLFDEFLQTYIYPNTTANWNAFMRALPSLHFPLRAGPHRIMGHQVIFVEELNRRVVAYPTWSLSLAPGEKIQAVVPSSHGPVASFGKVLGNRTTFYKYLNPRLFILLTDSTSASPPTCGIYLVDTTKGSIIYRTTVPSNAGTCDVKATLTENWLVYHYYEENFAAVGQTKGYRMVSVELYEGEHIDDKTKSSDMSSYSKQSTNVSAIEQSYVFPHDITAISTTLTKFGITAKDIIVANKNHQIQAWSRRLLNPRRPDRKPTAEEQEEFLIQYEPVLPNDPRRILSHNYKVANINRILTSPALLESTSLVFAYGLDLFLTRIAPSNTFDVLSENFNKAQLVLTVSGLALAIMITKPMVARKRLRERWYS